MSIFRASQICGRFAGVRLRSTQLATEFAEGKPFTSATLTWAASQLRKGVRANGKRREGGSRAKRERRSEWRKSFGVRRKRQSLRASLSRLVGR